MAKVGIDWCFLALLGIICSLLSFSMDWVISHCQRARLFLAKEFPMALFPKYMCWVGVPVSLTMLSAGFVHFVEPRAIGSGISEMKTILRGVPVKEYLTYRMLISKVVGLICSLSSGLPMGKEGPFVHISSIVSNLLSKVIKIFKSIYENESRREEMLAAACAVGVACSFAAPIGGVLFSIEVTSEYFRVRNYWRGFFAACFGTLVWRLLHVWQQDEETITALFKTNFESSFPFDPYELPVYVSLGIVTGILGVMFVKLHRRIVIFNRTCQPLKNFLGKHLLIYPAMVTLFISTLTFPDGFGQFIAAELTNHESVNELFRNQSWIAPNMQVDDKIVASHWTTPYTGIHINLALFIITTFFTTALAATLPIPSGVFIPTLKIGAALGRLLGEAMFIWFPNGMGAVSHQINPGAYAVAGAAAFAGSVTHTISTTVIMFELTGQITHNLPIIITTLVSNAFAQVMEYSIYDSIIQLKKLPYLPPIISASSQAHLVLVEDIMVKDIICIWNGITYKQLQEILNNPRKLTSYPLVESRGETLIGTRGTGHDNHGMEPKYPAKSLGPYFCSHFNNTMQYPVQLYRTQYRTLRCPKCQYRSYNWNRWLSHQSEHEYSGAIHQLCCTETMFLLGSIPRIELKCLLKLHLSRARRLHDQVRRKLLDDQLRHSQRESPSRFQVFPASSSSRLVEGTTLVKVHALFSMLGLNHAYVTAIGRLVGVVALKEVSSALPNLYKQ
ncbi:CLCN2 [Cordylochernes scorpioides]|uniref:CLCN2 n=1 Tax=Cordylochernes scorpioides TaxID=51811 RepID=A0ABY6LNB0_9ARAC|nr:CLCN2 [Cordylochernes scorpioides]